MATGFGTTPRRALGVVPVALPPSRQAISPRLTFQAQSEMDMERLPCVTVDAPLPLAGWRFKAGGSAAGIEFRRFPPIGHDHRGGAGRDPQCRFDAPAVLSGHLVHAARGQLPLKMRSFLDFAAPRLRQALRAIDSAG
jgi:hypothetical protein